MNFREKAKIANALIFRRATGQKKPVTVSWSITNRCNQNCGYCRWPNRKSDEPDRDQALGLIFDMAQSGVRVVVFTGGEPLLHEHIDEMIAFSRTCGLVVGMNTNGILASDHLEALKKTSYVQLSLEGPESVNDAIRGDGAFAATTGALELLKRNGIKVKLNTTLTQVNVDSLDYLLGFSKKQNVPIMFHPVSHVHAGDLDLAEFLLDDNALKTAFDKLIAAKGAGFAVLNSVPGMKLLQQPGGFSLPQCFAGRLFVSLTPQGHVVACNQLRDSGSGQDADGGNFSQAVRALKTPNCSLCRCASPIELNLFLSMNPAVILNAAKTKL